MGGRKLLHELKPVLSQQGIFRGRDAFFELLRRHGLIVQHKRNRRRTTYSGLWKYPNLLAGLPLTHTGQVWVGDITYLATETGFVYLSMLTDAYSRFIVGYDLSSSLVVEGCLRTLNMALRGNDESRRRGLIHHSDHGAQYSSWPYCHRLISAGIRPSMGEVGNCYENALAERMNGILKMEYGLDTLFPDGQIAERAVKEAVYLYNYERPHLSLNYRKPAEVQLV